MSSALRRLHSATGTVALVLALLALLASAAGAGYAAATIGTGDLQNNAVTAKKIKKNAVTGAKIKKNAVTAKKVKNGSLTAADLVAEEKQRAATLGNGGQADCLWQGAASQIPGIGAPTFRKDRFGTVQLDGVATASDAAGGDGVCDPFDPGQGSDGIVFTLPAGYIPAKTLLVGINTSVVIIAGAQGVTTPDLTLPPGAVFAQDVVAPLDDVSFEPAGSSVVIAKTKASGQAKGDALETLGLK